MTMTIRTYTGKLVNPLDPSPTDIHLADIAHALSLICRYTGHGPFISVAEHSLEVARFLAGKPIDYRIHGLLHDAAEAYLGDIPSPWKPLVSIAGEPFDAIESRVLAAIYSGLSVPMPSPAAAAAVADIDHAVRQGERARYARQGARRPLDVEHDFLDTFVRLTPHLVRPFSIGGTV